jgi:hypothetical protein
MVMGSTNLTKSDGFGGAIALEGDLAVIGASPGYNNYPGIVVPAAYIYERSGSAWTRTAILEPSAPHDFQFFGAPVAMSGSIVVVGAPSPPSSSGPNVVPGAAYVYERTSAGWIEQAKLLASDGFFRERLRLVLGR